MSDLNIILSRAQFHNVTPFNFHLDRYTVFDLTEANEDLTRIKLNDEEEFNEFIFGTLKENKAVFGVGRYNEDRLIYKRSDLFAGGESRSLHLGIDIWAKAGTPVFAPYHGTVHSFANNNTHGDYGPTIILRHDLDGNVFHTLYGHLSLDSIDKLTIGQAFREGDLLAHYGSYEENVHWPPHLHFQVVKDMYDYRGDFPGVCQPREKNKWLRNCPDPNLILGLDLE